MKYKNIKIKSFIVNKLKYTELAQHFQQIISTCEKLRDNLTVFMILHSEDVQSDKTTTGYKVSTVGNLVDKCYNSFEIDHMVLYL